MYRPKDFYTHGNPKSVGQALSRMEQQGEMEKVARGQYKYLGEGKGTKGLSADQQKNALQLAKLRTMHGILQSRSEFFNRIGIGFDGKRDNWKALGYSRVLHFNDFFQAYKRGDIAQRIVDAPAKATWRNPPIVKDDEGEDGEFAEAWQDIVEEFSLYRELERADIRARIGRFGVILLGFRGKPDLPARRGQNLLFVSSYMENKVKIMRFVEESSDPRFGLPLKYQIDVKGSLDSSRIPLLTAHHSRILHIAEDPIEDDIYGKPALEAVFNKLFDLEKVVGGAAESVWKTFDRGLFVNLDADAELDEESMADLDDNIEKYIHGHQRVLKGQGLDIETLGATAADPRGHFQVLASIVSGTTGIPQRILFGSERGQLASSMDERNWNARIRERQLTFAEPNILKPLLRKLIDLRVLPEPKGRLKINWPDLTALSESEQLENAKLQAQAIRNLADKNLGINFMTREEKRRVALPQFDPKVPEEIEGGVDVPEPPESESGADS